MREDDEGSVSVELVAVSPASIIVMLLTVAGVIALAIAIVNERRMQDHRQPGVSYRDVTFRLDGGWKKTDLFTDAGLRFQQRAAKWGMIGAACLVAALVALALAKVT